MKIEVNEDRYMELTEVYNPIVIKTERGKYGIAMRDWGIEIMKDGKLIFQDTEEPTGEKSPSLSISQKGTLSEDEGGE